MKKYLLIFIVTISCTSNQNELMKNYSDINFKEDLTFEEFKKKLKEYAINKPYPDINK